MTPDLLHRTALRRIDRKIKEYTKLYAEKQRLGQCGCKQCNVCIRLSGINIEMMTIERDII